MTGVRSVIHCPGCLIISSSNRTQFFHSPTHVLQCFCMDKTSLRAEKMPRFPGTDLQKDALAMIRILCVSIL